MRTASAAPAAMPFSDKEIMADVPNYTDPQPVMQISEVVVDRQ